MLEKLEGMKAVKQNKYLSLPLVIGRSKTQVCDFVKKKVHSRILGWREKMLNMAGKEVLLKSVVMSLPAYVMSCYKLPKEVCKGIGRDMAKF